MAMIHALLLVSHKPLCTDEIMEELGISRGNACMNLKSLQEWGLVTKTCGEGCRKEFYQAEKDMFKVFRQILIHRRKEELEPLIDMMDRYVDLPVDCDEAKAFSEVVSDIKYFSKKADATLDTLIRSTPDWFVGSFMKMLR